MKSSGSRFVGLLLICTSCITVFLGSLHNILFHFYLQDIEFVEKRIEDLDKQMKRSNDKQLKIEHELCQRVGFILNLFNSASYLLVC